MKKIKVQIKSIILGGLLLFSFSSCVEDSDQIGSNDSILQNTETRSFPTQDVPTSAGLPKGMVLRWNDEFNDMAIDRTKWSTNYYSLWDFIDKTNFEDMQNNTLPQPAIEYTGSSIILKTNDEVPERPYWENGRKISSIQTYDWRENKDYMGNLVGGYIEARIKRNAINNAGMVNTAFWFDSPGPDLRYYMEKGNTALGATGIRPRGQVFEIDMCEYITTNIVLHGDVAADGTFERNIAAYNVRGNFTDRWVSHGILWSPAGLKFYIDGKLVKEWWSSSSIKSPNHAMNLFLGAYGKGGEVTVEADYVRFYQWDLGDNNELPNSGFEYHNQLFPWEGSAKIDSQNALSGLNCAHLRPFQNLSQYVYLDYNSSYELKFSGKGTANIEVSVENITPVNGKVESSVVKNHSFTENTYSEYSIPFITTTSEYKNHKQTLKVTFRNKSLVRRVYLDDITISKI